MAANRGPATSLNSTTVADLLERVLDKGIVIAGDIKVKLVDIELLSIQIRLVICSVDKAREMGMDWWVNNPVFAPKAEPTPLPIATTGTALLAEDAIVKMQERLAALERLLETKPIAAALPTDESPAPRAMPRTASDIIDAAVDAVPEELLPDLGESLERPEVVITLTLGQLRAVLLDKKKITNKTKRAIIVIVGANTMRHDDAEIRKWLNGDEGQRIEKGLRRP